MNAINICLASDDNYCTHLGVCIISILENNNDKINIHILNNNISRGNIEKLNSLKDKYSRLDLFFYNIHDYFKEFNIDNLINCELNNNEFFKILGISTFSRLFMADILPNEIDKILYLDSDIVVLRDLHEFYNIDLKDNYCAGVIDIMSNISKSYHNPNAQAYINCGVLLISLEKWRKINFSKLSIDMIKNYNNKEFLNDQNIINMISEKHKLIVDPKYNTMAEFFYVNYEKNLKINNYFGSIEEFYSINEMENALENPTIVHFMSQIWDRPWFENKGKTVKNPYNEKYLYYKSISPWKDTALLKDNNNLYFKIIRFLMIHFPSFLLARLYKIKNDCQFKD